MNHLKYECKLTIYLIRDNKYQHWCGCSLYRWYSDRRRHRRFFRPRPLFLSSIGIKHRDVSLTHFLTWNFNKINYN